MIRSLFETEDAPGEKDRTGDEKVKRTEPGTASGLDAAAAPPAAGNKETQPFLFKESEIARERGVQEEIVSIGPDDVAPEISPEQIIKKLERDDDLLELEIAVSKIEEDLGAERQTVPEKAGAGEPLEKASERPEGSGSDEFPVFQTPVREALKKQIVTPPPTVPEPPAAFLVREIEDQDAQPVQTVPPAEVKSATAPAAAETQFTGSEAYSNKDFKPQSKAAIIRQSGLAWSAAIVLFGSIVFLMIIGWFADLLIGSTPWGLGIGIVLGAIIGFYQFFKLTSEILKNKE